MQNPVEFVKIPSKISKINKITQNPVEFVKIPSKIAKGVQTLSKRSGARNRNIGIDIAYACANI